MIARLFRIIYFSINLIVLLQFSYIARYLKIVLISMYSNKNSSQIICKSLQTHWNLLKHYHLLPDQSAQPMPRHEEVINFSDAEELIDRELQQQMPPIYGNSSKEDAIHQ